MKRFSKYHVALTTCPKCKNKLRSLPSFEGRPRFYCDRCKEEVLNFPWSAMTPYPQDTSLPSPSTQDGSH